MIPSSFVFDLLIFFGLPMLVLVIYGRRANRTLKQAERDSLPFAPPPDPEPGAFLRRFSPPQRAYLRRQLKPVPYVFVFLTWIFVFLLTVPVFTLSSHAHLWTDLPTMYWFTFLSSITDGPQFEVIFVFFAAFGAMITLRWGGGAVFYRTRPVPFGTLFWGRVLPGLAVFVLSILTALLLAIGLFYLAHGAAWQHLPRVIPRKLGPDDADVAASYAALLVSSVPRIFLSFFTTICLYAGIAILVVSLPFGKPGRTSIPVKSFLILGLFAMLPSTLNLVAAFSNLHAPRWLFLYTQFGPPPPYIYALVPLAFAALNILLARWLIARSEL